jgi:hypothetical protein
MMRTYKFFANTANYLTNLPDWDGVVICFAEFAVFAYNL